VATEYPKKSPGVVRVAAQQAVDVAAEKVNATLQAKADKLVKKTAKKAEDKVAKTTKKVDLAAAKVKGTIAGHHEAAHAHHQAHRAGDDPLEVWTRQTADARRPRFTRDDIAAAAIRIADAEGLDAVSMRRLAAELDVGTMTLYHYIATKDELLTLVFDGIMQEMVLPPGTRLPADWRAAITVIARRSRDTMRRHPWVFDITDDPPLGPNSVRHFDQSHQALAGLDIPLALKIDILTTVDEYVFGYCLHERNNYAEGDDALSPQMEQYLGTLIATGEYPALGALTADAPLRDVWRNVSSAMRDNRRFDRNLARILDGFEQSFPTEP
jgi:AcrR family transcriptional regulator